MNTTNTVRANLVWVKTDEGPYLPIRNYNPEIKLEEQKQQQADQQQQIQDTVNEIISAKHKEISVDQLREDDVVFHKEHGLLRVNSVEYEEGVKNTFVC